MNRRCRKHGQNNTSIMENLKIYFQEVFTCISNNIDEKESIEPLNVVQRQKIMKKNCHLHQPFL